MGKIISLLNHKGGVGKTTSTINIGAGLVELGKKVLLIDLDPQANLTLSLGIPRQKYTIYEAVRGESELVPFTVKEGLDVITSTCLLYTSPSPRDKRQSRMPSSA